MEFSGIIDLHMHSTASDGQYTPSQLVKKARESGIAVMALSDHDTFSGIAEALAAAEEEGIRAIPGIELSASTAQGTETHILGHFIDISRPELAEFSRRMKEERVRRMRKMIDKMNALGVDLTYEEVAFFSKGEAIGRTHLTRVLMARGVVSDLDEAFRLYLGKGCPAYVPREKLTAEDAIALIHSVGGSATIAHALASRVLPEEIRRLKKMGLDGLEVWHPRHSEEQRGELLALSKELNLIPTAGSDFHGEKVAPARILGAVRTPPESLEALERAAESSRKRTAAAEMRS